MLSKYPPQVVERAISPSRGLPAYVSYPNLAKFRELLDEWSEIVWEEELKRRNSRMARLPPGSGRMVPGRMEDPPQGHFANVFVPATHDRYESLCEWAKTADPKFWIYGKASDQRAGIWVPLNIWDEGVTALKRAAEFATMTIDQLRGHYAKRGDAA